MFHMEAAEGQTNALRATSAVLHDEALAPLQAMVMLPAFR